METPVCQASFWSRSLLLDAGAIRPRSKMEAASLVWVCPTLTGPSSLKPRSWETQNSLLGCLQSFAHFFKILDYFPCNRPQAWLTPLPGGFSTDGGTRTSRLATFENRKHALGPGTCFHGGGGSISTAGILCISASTSQFFVVNLKNLLTNTSGPDLCQSSSHVCQLCEASGRS